MQTPKRGSGVSSPRLSAQMQHHLDIFRDKKYLWRHERMRANWIQNVKEVSWPQIPMVFLYGECSLTWMTHPFLHEYLQAKVIERMCLLLDILFDRCKSTVLMKRNKAFDDFGKWEFDIW